MKKYVALLRGINVGGNNKINISALKESFESVGFLNVLTYINSGNVIFDTNLSSEKNIVARIKKLIKKDFALEIPVLVRDQKNIEEICDAIPTKWKNDKDQKTDVMFLWEEYADKSVIEKLRVEKGIDTVRYIDRACVWHLAKKDYTKSGINDIIGTKLYKGMTVRNINTLRKIRDLMDQ